MLMIMLAAGVQDPDQLILQKQNFLAQLQGKDEQLVVNKKKLVRAQRKKYATQQVGGDWWTAGHVTTVITSDWCRTSSGRCGGRRSWRWPSTRRRRPSWTWRRRSRPADCPKNLQTVIFRTSATRRSHTTSSDWVDFHGFKEKPQTDGSK